MANNRERRLRRKYSARLRRLELDADLRAVALAGIRYADQIYAPNIKEPFSLDTARRALVQAVDVWRSKRGLPPMRLRRAA